MNIDIRKFRKSDANEVYKIIKDCYANLDIGGHSIQGTKLQIESNTPEKIIERAGTIKYLVAAKNGQIIGVGGYDSTKIHTLFVLRQLHGRGIGQMILDEIIERAKNEGIKSLITWSTFYARDFYLKNGFTIVKEIFLPEDTKDISLIEMIRNI